MSDFKNVQPLADFNWDEFENGTNAGSNIDDIQKAYDETLNKVTEHQVVEGTVISADKKEVIVNIVTRAMVSFPLLNSATTPTSR